MILDKRIDYATIVVKRKRQGALKLEDGSFLQVKCVLGFEISQFLKATTKKEKKDDDFSLKDGSIYFGNRDERLELQFKGSFFIFNENYELKINEILNFIKAKGFEYHFTRLDVCYLLTEPVFKELIKSDYKKLDTNETKERKKHSWFSCFSTIFGVVSYDKKRQLKKVKKSQPEYFKHYKDKYGEIPLYHFELRFFAFQYKKKNSPIITRRIPAVWEYPIDFKKAEQEIYKEILSRVKFSKKILHLIKNKGGT